MRQAFESLFVGELVHIVALFKSVIERGAVRIYRELAAIHPGESGRTVCLLLSKLALKISLRPKAFEECAAGCCASVPGVRAATLNAWRQGGDGINWFNFHHHQIDNRVDDLVLPLDLV